eukprot:scaffold41412_cov25-Tisochrysis_lutea.AAC.1
MPQIGVAVQQLALAHAHPGPAAAGQARPWMAVDGYEEGRRRWGRRTGPAGGENWLTGDEDKAV